MATCNQFCNLFALWVALCAGIAVKVPGFFDWMDPSVAPRLLTVLSFLVGTSTKLSEFAESAQRPEPIVANMAATFLATPVLSFVLARAVGLSEDVLAGMVLLGSVSGGTSSNLCALIAGADVPLSVLMTSTTTLASPLLTPLLVSLLLGAAVPVDSKGILLSALQIVLAPILFGVLFSGALPRTCAAVRPGIPVFAVAVGALIVGVVLSHHVEVVRETGSQVHACVVAFHISAGFLGYVVSSLMGGTETESRTVAFEVGMKNCALASMLAASHFEAEATLAPAAASLFWCPLLASVQAVVWSSSPMEGWRKKKDLDDDGDDSSSASSRAMGA